MPPGAELERAAEALLARAGEARIARLFDRALFIVSAPRAGSTLLFEQLARREGVVSIGGESHGVLRAFPELRAEDATPASGRLDGHHATERVRRLLPACFACLLRDRHGRPAAVAPQLSVEPPCFLEKTPRNALNIPFLLGVFPRARFVYLQRDARDNVASLIEAWQHGLQSGRFVTFRDLPGWDRPGWCFLLPRGWQSLIGRSLAEIAAFQWQASNETIMDDLGALPRDRHLTVDYRDLVSEPAAVLARLCRFAGIPDRVDAPLELPLSRTTLSPPARDKWRRREAEIESVMPGLANTSERMQAFDAGRR